MPEPEFVEAAGVLQLIDETPEQLHEYSARLKLRLDEAARLEYARTEAEEQGIQKRRQQGELIGQIILLQELLGIELPTRDELSKYAVPQLSELAEQRREQLRTRGW